VKDRCTRCDPDANRHEIPLFRRVSSPRDRRCGAFDHWCLLGTLTTREKLEHLGCDCSSRHTERHLAARSRNSNDSDTTYRRTVPKRRIFGLPVSTTAGTDVSREPLRRSLFVTFDPVGVACKRSTERRSIMHPHPLIRAELARERQLGLLRDGAQPPIRVPRPPRRQRLLATLTMRRATVPVIRKLSPRSSN
jgi:hypothetical protein